MASSVGLDLGTTLLFTGAYNLYSGAAFGVPMPVQPMKSIAAVAITDARFTLAQALLAGIMVSAAVLMLGVTGLATRAQRLVPDAIVRGVQLGLGLKLAAKGLRMALLEGGRYRRWVGGSGLLVSLAAALYVLVSVVPPDQAAAEAGGEDSEADGVVACLDMEGGQLLAGGLPAREGSGAGPLAADSRCERGVGIALRWLRRLPASVVLVAVGLVMAAVADPSAVRALRLGPAVPSLLRPGKRDWWPALVHGAMPQLPLTLLNSVVSVTLLSRELFPEAPVSARHVAVSVGAMNLVGPWFGALPVCHGAGGLASQARFGARSGLAPMLLGAGKLALGLAFGGSMLAWFRKFPDQLLGVMLVLSGTELASSAAKLRGSKRAWLVILITAAGCMAIDTGAGFAAGVFAAACTCDWLSHARSAAAAWRALVVCGH